MSVVEIEKRGDPKRGSAIIIESAVREMEEQYGIDGFKLLKTVNKVDIETGEATYKCFFEVL